MEFIRQPWMRALVFTALLGAGFGLRYILVYFATKWPPLARLVPQWSSLQKKFSGSLDIIICAVLIHLVVPLLGFSDSREQALTHIGSVMLTLAATWFLVQLVDFLAQGIQLRLATTSTDDLRQRRMRTQIQFVSRLSIVLILLVGFAATLMSFDGARRIGASLIASAGVASIVVGFAAQKSLANLIAGFQIAFTQPIRIGDVVVVETEWGTIEEISLTYVVVKIWDLRRLILPITYFVEKPFQNWTRTSAAITGYFFLYADYRVPVAQLREELHQLAAASPLWDRQTCVLQMTNVTEKTVELRALVGARSAGDAFDLKCLLREQMLDYITTHLPSALPVQRAFMTMEAPSEPPGAAYAAAVRGGSINGQASPS